MVRFPAAIVVHIIQGYGSFSSQPAEATARARVSYLCNHGLALHDCKDAAIA